MLALVNSAYITVFDHLLSAGDGLLPSGSWIFSTPMLSLSIMDANNHQVTWGVLASTLWGIKEFMTATNVYACANIWIFDGINLVGIAKIVLRGQ